MRVHTSGVGLALMVIMTVAGCGKGDGQATAKGSTVPSTAVSSYAARTPGSATPEPISKPSASGKRVTYADLPEPTSAARAAYFADLNTIDPAIIAGRPSTTFILPNSMGTCLELANHQEPQRILTETIIALDNERAQLTKEEGARIVEAIHQDLCPMY